MIESLKTYQPIPEDRLHSCHEVNAAKVPVAWIIYEPDHGFQIESTDCYGGGTLLLANFCPWCGERLHFPNYDELLSGSGRKNRMGIVVKVP